MKTTTGAVDEASELFKLIERHERVTAAKTRVAVADSRYTDTADLIVLAQHDVSAIDGVSDSRASKAKSTLLLSAVSNDLFQESPNQQYRGKL